MTAGNNLGKYSTDSFHRAADLERIGKSTPMRKIKVGALLFHSAQQDRFYCGTHRRAIVINSPEEKSFIQNLGESPQGSEQLEERLLERLKAAQLLDESVGVVTLSKRFTSKIAKRAAKSSDRSHDAAYQQMQKRLAPELNQSTWLDGVTDGGAAVISARQRYTVEISGSSRIALLLYTLLLASGLTHVRFASDFRYRDPLVGDSDIGIAQFSQRDIGLPIRSLCDSLRRDISLFPSDNRVENGVDCVDAGEAAELKIHCGGFDPEILAMWMSTGQNFLHIAEAQGDRVTVGPLVIPGKSPCVRCFQLALSDNSEIVGVSHLQPEASREFPNIAAHYIASLAAWQVIQFLDSQTLYRKQEAELVGTVYAVDYQLLSHPEVIALPRHPLCGCAF